MGKRLLIPIFEKKSKRNIRLTVGKKEATLLHQWLLLVMLLLRFFGYVAKLHGENLVD